MSEQTKRRARILGVRATQLQIAKAALAGAERDRLTLTETADRLVRLRQSLGTGAGPISGQPLASGAELATRLDAARSRMTIQIGAAGTRRDSAQATLLSADRLHRAADKLHALAASIDILTRDRRDDANRPFRKRKAQLGTTS
jgi:hypothetical protein